MKVIDVSTFQGVIDWEKAKTEIDGAILRCGYGSDQKSQDDAQFERNAAECERLGIPYGVYIYSYATNESMAKSEAEHVLRLIKGKTLSFPVYIDCEEERAEIRNYAKTACEVMGKIIEGAGYSFGVYANLNWWNNYLVGLNQYTRWVAQYAEKCTYKNKYDMWQYTSSGTVAGINGNVDMNYCYRDFGVKSGNITPSVANMTLDQVANDVLNGKYGNGQERVNRIAAANLPFTYNQIQTRVNQMLAGSVVTSKTYRVKKGDTLGKIAAENNTTVSKLVKLNGINNPNLIFVGQILKIN